MPNSDSRVLLGSDTDALGMPRLVVQWRFRDAELHSICRAYRVLASAIAKSGLGEVQLDPDLLGSVQHALVPQGGDHIGTVRMSADASTGVVDTNGEVWGTRGLPNCGNLDSSSPTSALERCAHISLDDRRFLEWMSRWNSRRMSQGLRVLVLFIAGTSIHPLGSPTQL
jgi:hypothetical protein